MCYISFRKNGVEMFYAKDSATLFEYFVVPETKGKWVAVDSGDIDKWIAGAYARTDVARAGCYKTIAQKQEELGLGASLIGEERVSDDLAAIENQRCELSQLDGIDGELDMLSSILVGNVFDDDILEYQRGEDYSYYKLEGEERKDYWRAQIDGIKTDGERWISQIKGKTAASIHNIEQFAGLEKEDDKGNNTVS